MLIEENKTSITEFKLRVQVDEVFVESEGEHFIRASVYFNAFWVTEAFARSPQNAIAYAFQRYATICLEAGK